MKDLEKVLPALQSANLTLKTSKYQSCRRERRCLGHIIPEHSIRSDPNLIKSVTNFPQQKKAKGVQSFLCLTGYYRRFIQDYSKIAEPLLQQLRNSKRQSSFKMVKEMHRSFRNVKRKMKVRVRGEDEGQAEDEGESEDEGDGDGEGEEIAIA